MGVHYFYVNETKKQYFCIDPVEVSLKLHALGRNIGSRALSYLILRHNHHYTGINAHPLLGSWIGDTFYVTGDAYELNFNQIETDFTDIGQAILEMLTVVRPYDFLEYGGVNWIQTLIAEDGDPITLTEQMRNRLIGEFRREIELGSNDERLPKIISALNGTIESQ